MFSSTSSTTINSTSSFIKSRTKSNNKNINIKKSKLKSIMSFDKCLKIGKIARNFFKFKAISKKIKENDDENRSITNVSLLENINHKFSIPIEKDCNYDLLILNSSCNCQNNFEIYKCDHDFKPFFNINTINQAHLNINKSGYLDYEFMDSFNQHKSNIVLNSSTVSTSTSDNESEENNCCCCKSSSDSQDLLESEYFEFVNTFGNNHSKNTRENSLHESLKSLSVSNSISLSSSYNSESSLDNLINRIDTNNISYNKNKSCSCFNLSNNDQKNQLRVIESIESDFEEELNIEINHCLIIIKDINSIKMNLDDDNLLTRTLICITDYEPILDDDLQVSFAEAVTVLKNNNESDDWFYVRSVKTGNIGYIPRYIAMDLDIFLQQVKTHCNKLISSKRKINI